MVFALCATASIFVLATDATIVYARRATCEEIVLAREGGQSGEQIAFDLGTTAARVEACARIATQQAEQAARQERVRTEREQRALRFH